MRGCAAAVETSLRVSRHSPEEPAARLRPMTSVQRIARCARVAMVLACLWSASVSAQDAAQSALADCVSRLEAANEQGFTKIAEACSGLDAALAQHGYGPWLPEQWWDEELSREDLAELRDLITPAPTREAGAAADPEQLAAVLRDLKKSQEKPPSVFRRFLDWLRRLMSNQEDDPWFQRWEKKIEGWEAFSRAASYSLFALILALAALLVLNELRAAGVFDRLRSRRKGSSAGSATGLADGARTPGLSEIELLQRPAWLLDRVLA